MRVEALMKRCLLEEDMTSLAALKEVQMESVAKAPASWAKSRLSL